MPQCGIYGGKAPRQPCIAEEGPCDLGGKDITPAEEAKKERGQQ